MNVKKTINYLKWPLLLSPVLFTGCGTTGGNASYVDSYGTGTVVSMNKINIQDWNQAADDLVADLLSSGALDQAPERPVVMAISRIINDTDLQLNITSLTKKISIRLNQTGRVLTTTTMGYRGGVADPVAAEAAQLDAFMTGKKAETKMPYYTLSGRLMQDSASAGSTNQVSYIFQLSLTTVKDGLAIWEGEKIITKQGRQSTVGW